MNWLRSTFRYSLMTSSRAFSNQKLTPTQKLLADISEKLSWVDVKVDALHAKLDKIYGKNKCVVDSWCSEDGKGDVDVVPDFPMYFTDSSYESWGDFSSPLPESASVSTVIQETMDVEDAAVLERWKRRMTEELGEGGFRAHQREVKQKGAAFHSLIQRHLSGEPVAADTEGYWQSVRPVLEDLGTVHDVEKHVRHPQLNYSGYVDCVASYRGLPHVVEWKTSGRRRETLEKTYDNPLQVAAYLGAWNAVERDGGGSTERHPVHDALLVVCYEDGRRADVHEMPEDVCQHYWTLWLRRLHRYWKMKRDIASFQREPHL